MKTVLLAVLLTLISVAPFTDMRLPCARAGGPAQQGCCSYHGGVCGCFAGRTQCCDGTQSPSCHCNNVVTLFTYFKS